MKFEEWLANKIGDSVEFTLLAMAILPPTTEMLLDGYLAGARTSKDLLVNMRLQDPAFARLAEFRLLPCFPEFERAFARGDIDAAYDLLVDNGVTTSPCCQGDNEDCEFQQAIDEALQRRRHRNASLN